MSTALIKSLTSSALLAMFNGLAASTSDVNTVSKFSDRKTAEARLAKLIEATGHKLVEVDGVATLVPVAQPDTDPVEKAKDDAAIPPLAADTPATKVRKKRGYLFKFPKKDEIKAIRPNTKRATAIELLGRPEGASFAEVQAATGWAEKDAYEGIRLIHFWVGYGMFQDDEGRIHIVK